jgi:hypothetical protein
VFENFFIGLKNYRKKISSPSGQNLDLRLMPDELLPGQESRERVNIYA